MYHQRFTPLGPLLFCICCTALTVPARAATDDIAACEVLFAAHPEVEASSSCFFDLGQKQGLWVEAAGALERLLARHPKNPWGMLYLGHLKWREIDTAGRLYQQAAQLFSRRSEARGEYLALASLHRIVLNRGEIQEAERVVTRAVAVAEASEDPGLVARSQVLQAKHLQLTGQDLGRAYLLLRRAESVLFPDGDYPAQRDCLNSLANVSIELGRTAEGRLHYDRMAELAAAQSDRFAEALARLGTMRSLIEENAEMPRDEAREELLAVGHKALAAGEAAGHTEVVMRSSQLLGQLSSDRQEALRHLQRCRATAVSLQDRSYCLDALARRLAEESPAEAQAAIDEALDFARQAESSWAKAFAWRERMRVAWAAGEPLAVAVADSLAALDAIEALRDHQQGEGQAGMFSTWTDTYHWLSGRLFDVSSGGGEALGIAFSVNERMRARALIDALEAVSASPASADAARGLQARRAEVLEAISRVQRRLLTPGLAEADREAARAELEQLELEEADLASQVSQADPAFAALRRPDFASLDEVRRALAPDQALLSFQVAPWRDWTGDFGGGSWVLVVTRDGARVHRLPDRVELRPAIALFTGLFEARDGSEVAPSVRLHKKLLSEALDGLPRGIRRLVLVPDDALFQLPFAALRPTADAPPLGARYELSVVPSATLWLRWTGQRPGPAAAPVLVFADPPPPGGSNGDVRLAEVAPASERAAVFSGDLRLGALPYARREGRAVVRHLGRGGELRIGEEASESFAKAADLARFGILHFAAHAVTDEEKPDRSGVVLAAGTAGDDGLLQIREIVDLKLGGRIVVLSSCRSATGVLLRGEGVMSLARAFFQAGSHAVIGSLWPLRDDEAAALFDRFYRHLGRGESVAAALTAAQRDSIAAGDPAAAWAGLVVLGDGDLVPLPGGRRRPAVPQWALAAGVVALLSLLGVAAWRRLGRRPAAAPEVSSSFMEPPPS